MPYLILKDGKGVQVPVRVVKADGHQSVYAHGAIGGPLANYHYKIDFYVDEVPPYNHIDPVGDGSIDPESIAEMKRIIVGTVFLSMPAAKELQLWLTKNLAEFENLYGDIQLPKGNIDADSIAKMGLKGSVGNTLSDPLTGPVGNTMVPKQEVPETMKEKVEASEIERIGRKHLPKQRKQHQHDEQGE